MISIGNGGGGGGGEYNYNGVDRFQVQLWVKVELIL